MLLRLTFSICICISSAMALAQEQAPVTPVPTPNQSNAAKTATPDNLKGYWEIDVEATLVQQGLKTHIPLHGRPERLPQVIKSLAQNFRLGIDENIAELKFSPIAKQFEYDLVIHQNGTAILTLAKPLSSGAAFTATQLSGGQKHPRFEIKYSDDSLSTKNTANDFVDAYEGHYTWQVMALRSSIVWKRAGLLKQGRIERIVVDPKPDKNDQLPQDIVLNAIQQCSEKNFEAANKFGTKAFAAKYREADAAFAKNPNDPLTLSNGWSMWACRIKNPANDVRILTSEMHPNGHALVSVRFPGWTKLFLCLHTDEGWKLAIWNTQKIRADGKQVIE